MSLRVYSGFLGRLTLESREYAVLKNAVIESSPGETVKIVCDNAYASLLLNRAMAFYPEALPFIQLGLDNCVKACRTPERVRQEFSKTLKDRWSDEHAGQAGNLGTYPWSCRAASVAGLGVFVAKFYLRG